MIPRYFSPNTSYSDLKVSIGNELKNCFSCVVTQEKNGAYTCAVEIGANNTVEVGGYIKAKACNYLQPQIFKITTIAISLSRIVITSEHIKFILNDIPIIAEDTGEVTVSAAVAMLKQRALGYYPIPFDFDVPGSQTCEFNWTDYEYHTMMEYLCSSNDYSVSTIANGFFEFDNFDVKFYSNSLNHSSGTEIEYGKNLVNINYSIDNSSVYNCVFLIYYRTNSQSDSEICFKRKPNPRLYKNGDIVHNSGEHIFPNADSLYKLANFDADKPKPYILNIADSSAKKYGYHFSEAAAVSSTSLDNFMVEWLADNQSRLMLPMITASVTFADTDKSAEFTKFGDLKNLNVGKTVGLRIPPLKINASVTVASATYDSLTECYTSLSLSNTQQGVSRRIVEQQEQYKRLLKAVGAMPTLISTITSTPID